MSPVELVRRFASGLRFPQLFMFVLGLFLLDFFIPDLIPYVDEMLLALATLLLGSWKERKGVPDDEAAGRQDPPMKDVTPPPANTP